MPEYFVHNHYSRITGDLEADDSTIMQSYDYGPLDIGPAIGFQVPTTHRRIRAPPRKVTVLETLPPLSLEVAVEVTHPVKVREQAELLAAIREAQEEVPKRQKRANRAKQTKYRLIYFMSPHLVVSNTLRPLFHQSHSQQLSHDQNVSNSEFSVVSP